jgi:hypothetical protein
MSALAPGAGPPYGLRGRPLRQYRFGYSTTRQGGQFFVSPGGQFRMSLENRDCRISCRPSPNSTSRNCTRSTHRAAAAVTDTGGSLPITRHHDQIAELDGHNSSLIGWMMVVRTFAPRTSLAYSSRSADWLLSLSPHESSSYHGGRIPLQAAAPWLTTFRRPAHYPRPLLATVGVCWRSSRNSQEL